MFITAVNKEIDTGKREANIRILVILCKFTVFTSIYWDPCHLSKSDNPFSHILCKLLLTLHIYYLYTFIYYLHTVIYYLHTN